MPALQVEVFAFPIMSTDEANQRLRELLGERLGADPDDVAIATGRDGKPRLRRRPDDPDIRFNLSHSGELGAVAIAEGTEVGIDVERITPKRNAAYLRKWTRHEAYVKGLGVGIRQRPQSEAPGWRIFDLDLISGYVGALAADSEVNVRVSLDPALAQST